MRMLAKNEEEIKALTAGQRRNEKDINRLILAQQQTDRKFNRLIQVLLNNRRNGR